MRTDKEKCLAAAVETKCGECNLDKQTKLDDTVETTPEHHGIGAVMSQCKVRNNIWHKGNSRGITEFAPML